MKTERNIFIAFILNLAFSVFEFIGGIITGSVAIISDSMHDLGDALSIGISFFLERKSKRQPDDIYTYGYARYSVIGSVITTLILLVGSVAVVINAVQKIITPTEINYNGMIIFAIFGVCVNLIAAMFTHDGDSLNQKAVNLHMMEDVLGWAVVLIGSVVIKFTDLTVLDPLMSIGVAVFIFTNALKGLKKATELFLEKTPSGVEVSEITHHVSEIEGVIGVHHVHVWSIDGHNNYLTMHVVTSGDARLIKKAIREELSEHGIGHATLELETEDERCSDTHCHVEKPESHGHHHHHH